MMNARWTVWPISGLMWPPHAWAAPEALGWTDVLLPLALALLAAGAAWWLMRLRGGRWARKGGPVEIVQVLPLGTRERILLVRVADEYLLVGATPTQINLIQRVTDPSPLDKMTSQVDPIEDAIGQDKPV